MVLSAVNAAARGVGLRQGQAHADARAIVPNLLSAPAEPEQDRSALHRLALWAERFSPSVGMDAATPGLEGLVLDMTGGAHLFGGEAALLTEIERRLKAAGVPAQAAIADTPGAAWALARFSDARIAPEGCTREALAELPVEALRLEERTLKLLRRFGLQRIGDLYGLPRSGLARRFRSDEGMALVRRFDQALGVEAEPLQAVRAAPLYRSWRLFAEPLIDIDGVGWALPELVQALSAQLERDSRGARKIRLTAFRVDGRTTSLEAGLGAPVFKPDHLIRLFRERGLERLDLGFGADALMVEALKSEATGVRQIDLDRDRDKAGGEALSALVDRIDAKLGDGAATRPALRESHIPERSEIWSGESSPPPQSGGGGPRSGGGGGPHRPLFLFDPPELIETVAELPDSAPVRFVWRRVSRKVARAEGPERLSSEWWNTPAARTRDYYRVEDEDGRRYWLYREGLYGRDDMTRLPTWWLHGVFA